MDGPENANFPLLFIVKMSLRRVGGWVVQKSLKTPLRNIEMAPYPTACQVLLFVRGLNFEVNNLQGVNFIIVL